jgi:phenylpropionate dioxygenase-like ring-hydroxylating dioxygenase large terminal subunit
MELIAVCDSKTNTAPDFPMGWWSLARSHELQVGEVKAVSALDRDLVLYRTRSGAVRVHDAYCPHLGAHLGINGRVVGEAIQCPFHGWQFGADGACQHIPYCEDIPARAKVNNWPTSEVNGEIYMWFHPTGEAPLWEVPAIDQLGNDAWTAPRQVEFTIPVHIQDIAENSCDPEHFQYVHKQNDTPPSSVTVEDDGAVHLHADIDANGIPGHLHATMFQPGLARVQTSYGPGAEMIVYNSAQPISQNETLLRWTLTVCKDIEDLAGDAVMNGIIDGLQDDYPIWKHKVHRRQPIFCKGDETLVLFRKWVRRFYLESSERGQQ